MSQERVGILNPLLTTAGTWQEQLGEAQLPIKVDELLSFNLMIKLAREAIQISWKLESTRVYWKELIVPSNSIKKLKSSRQDPATTLLPSMVKAV